MSVILECKYFQFILLTLVIIGNIYRLFMQLEIERHQSSLVERVHSLYGNDYTREQACTSKSYVEI